MLRAVSRVIRILRPSAKVLKPAIKPPALSRHIRFSSSSYKKSYPHTSTVMKTAAVIGAGAATTAIVCRAAERRTEDEPITGLKFLYAKRFHDEEKRRQAGIIPADLFKAAKIALTQGDSELACRWYKTMTCVHPKIDEIDFYKEAADFLLANNYVHDAVKLWEYTLDPSQLPARMIQAGNKLLEINKVDEAVTYWEKVVDEKEMPLFLEKAGNAFYGMGKMKRAVYYWEAAETKGSKSPAMLMHLSHQYVTSSNSKGIEKAEDTLKKIIITHPHDSVVLNELGVVLYMNAITWQRREKFYEIRLMAMTYFEKALKADPTNEIAAKNLEIVKVLDNRAHYGSPHRNLSFTLGKPTFMFDAILQDLSSNRDEIHVDVGVGITSTSTYDDKGNYTGSRSDFVPTVITRSTPRITNETAIKDLIALRMHWDEINLHKKSEASVSPSVDGVKY